MQLTVLITVRPGMKSLENNPHVRIDVMKEQLKAFASTVLSEVKVHKRKLMLVLAGVAVAFTVHATGLTGAVKDLFTKDESPSEVIQPLDVPEPTVETVDLPEVIVEAEFELIVVNPVCPPGTLPLFETSGETSGCVRTE